VHTCTLDHPCALPNYQARGFTVFRTEEKIEELPDQPLEPWPGANGGSENRRRPNPYIAPGRLAEEPKMPVTLYAHPFSSYCQKVLIALYENDIPFELRLLAPGDERTAAEHAALWPLKRMPVLVDAGRTVVEASIIIEHLGLHHPGRTRLIPDDPRAALDVRMMDRFFDNYIMTPMQKIVLDSIRGAENRDRQGVAEARDLLETAYRWLDGALKGREWAVGDTPSLADCAAAPALFYADWSHPIGTALPALRAYRRRLLEWPPFARAVDEARPYRPFFPLGAPDRD
jgi:glutathione S-transferase